MTISDSVSLPPIQRQEATPMQALHAECEELAHTKPGDVQKIASLHFKMILNYYEDVREQAQRSFFWALVAAGVGTAFLVCAAIGYMMSTSANANLSLVAGVLIQVISAINFYLYARTARQFASFHICLERTNRFLLANSLCEHLSDEHGNEARKELIRIIANAPLLTLDNINGNPSQVVASS